MTQGVKDIILGFAYPAFLRELKEKNMYPCALNNNISKGVPSIDSIVSQIGNVCSIYDVYSFENMFFESKTLGYQNIKPFDKMKKDCTNKIDKIKFILYFILCDITNPEYFYHKLINRNIFIKDFIDNKICENNLF